MRFSETEISQLAKAWLAISLAFAIVWRGMAGLYGLNFGFIYLIAALTVGIAFLLHELAHKFVAQRYGCWAEFRSFDLGLGLAVVMSLLGFVFAAPGAVMIAGMVTREENGRIAAAGPITNLILAAGFYLATLTLNGSVHPGLGQMYVLLRLFLSFGYSINAWLAFFNLIPFGPLDGVKILNWSRSTWAALIIVAGFMTFSSV